MEKIINAFKQIEDLSEQEPDIVRPWASAYCMENSIARVSTIEDTYHELSSNANKLLNIGIVGRVKAGKSSLLNAIFFKGEDILPKAATPMTASLTLLCYGDNQASVELFNQGDIADIKKEHDAYLAIQDKKLQDTLVQAQQRNKNQPLSAQMQEKVRQAVEKSMLSQPARPYYELYEGIAHSPLLAQINQSVQGVIQTLNADSPQAIAAELNNYVGSAGANSMITKSAQLELAIPELQDLRIIDTPGLNDPVASRSQRTMDFIKQCDVIFVISPSSQFMSADDVSLMVNAIQEQSINKIYVVASQSDMTMISDVADKNNHLFDPSFENLRHDLQLSLADCMRGNDRQVLRDALSGAQVLLTSSICFSLERKLSSGQPLSDNEQLVLANLTETYPAAFSDQEQTLCSLRKLAGVSAVQEAIAQVRADKDAIIKERQAVFVRDQQASVERYIEYLQKKLEEEKANLEEADLDTIKKSRDELAKKRSEIADEVNLAFKYSFAKLKSELRDRFNAISQGFINKSNISADQSLDVSNKTYEYTTGILFWKRQHFGTETTKTIDPAVVRREVMAHFHDMSNRVKEVKEQVLFNWIDKAVLEEVAVTKNLDLSSSWCMENGFRASDIERAVKNSILQLEQQLPKLVVDDLFSQNDNRLTFLFTRSVSSAGGKLHNSEAEEFLSKVKDLLNWFDDEFYNRSQQFLTQLDLLSGTIDLAKLIFGSLDDHLASLEKQLADSNNSMVHYKKCQEKLTQIASELKEA